PVPAAPFPPSPPPPTGPSRLSPTTAPDRSGRPGSPGAIIPAMRPRPRPGDPPYPRSVRLWDPATLARLCRARDFLADRFRTRTSLEDAAREAGLSPFYFNRLFTQAFQETPHEFVTRLRIDEARRRLLKDHDSVTDICFDVGYVSPGSFSTPFSPLTGLSTTPLRPDAGRHLCP